VTAWGDTQLKVHLGRLTELEYLVVHRAGHSQRHVYELAYGGEDGREVESGTGASDASGAEDDGNRSGISANRSGENADRSGSGRGVVGSEVRPVLRNDSGSMSEPVGANEKTRPGSRVNGASYSAPTRPASSTRPVARAAARS
jgi:hypothetical protein